MQWTKAQERKQHFMFVFVRKTYFIYVGFLTIPVEFVVHTTVHIYEWYGVWVRLTAYTHDTRDGYFIYSCVLVSLSIHIHPHTTIAVVLHFSVVIPCGRWLMCIFTIANCYVLAWHGRHNNRTNTYKPLEVVTTTVAHNQIRWEREHIGKLREFDVLCGLLWLYRSLCTLFW